MEFYEVMTKRRTVREFQSRPVEADKVRRILEAGLMAPSNAHLKYSEFILLRDKEGRKNAVIEGLKARDMKSKEDSAWMCIENIMLAMAAEGLFGCTYTPYDSGGLKKYLGVPDGYEIASVIPFGYTAAIPEPWESEKLAARLHVDRW